MKAIVIENDQMKWSDVADPVPAAGEVVIRNVASAVNRADLAQRQGGYPAPPGASPILGLECAGEVVQLGAEVRSFKLGDSVCALLAGGGYAEKVAVPAGQVVPIPFGLSLADAAALPEVFATAYLNLFTEAHLQLGERVLIHAGASGVGTAAIQLCKEFGNPCAITASGDKLDACRALGADLTVDRKLGSWLDAVKGWAGSSGVDVILDPVGGQYLLDNLNALSVDGRLVLIGLLGGASANLPLGSVLMKRLRIIGSTLRARSIARKAAVMEDLLRRVWPAIAAGRIKPIVEARIPMSDAQKAHDLIASDTTIGKVLLTL